LEPFRLVYANARKYTRELVITTTGMLLLVGVQLLVPWIFKTLVAALTSNDLSNVTPDRIVIFAFIALAIYVARAILQFVRNFLAHLAGWSVMA
jgi:ATP-binding cassette subfamily B protein